MSGERKHEIENIKEVCLEEIEHVQSQEELQNVRDNSTCKKTNKYMGDCGLLESLR